MRVDKYREAFTRIKTEDVDVKKVTMDRVLGLKDLIAIGAGATLGAGVYVLSGDVAVNKAGPAVTLCFGIAAVASILSGVCYAELGCRVPKSGSGYAYLYATLGEAPAFAIGWCLLISYMVASSSVASALTTYLNDVTENWLVDNLFWPQLNKWGMRDAFDWPSFIVIILLGVLMCVGVEEMSMVTNVLLCLNLTTIAGIVILCLFGINLANWGHDTSLQSQSIPDFFDSYYNQTAMVFGTTASEDNPSFVMENCKGNTYNQAWSGAEPDHGWKMECELKEKYLDMTNPDIQHCWKNDTDKNGVFHHYIDLQTNYGKRRYEVLRNDSDPAQPNSLILEDSSPGTGGYIPFGWKGVFAGASTCFYGFIGFDAIATTGEEAINPQENIPKAITYALALICVVYLAVSGLLTLNFPYFAMNDANPFAGAMAWNGFGWVINPIRIGAIAALIASLIGGMFPMPRILYNMSDDGLVYAVFGKINEKTKVPQNATIVCSVIAAFMAAVFDLKVLVDFLSIGTLAAYTIVGMCVIILRYRPDDDEKLRKHSSLDKLQGIRAQGLTLTMAVIMLFGFLITEKVLPVIEVGVEMDTSYIYWAINIGIAGYTVYASYVLSQMTESQTVIAFKTPCLPYFPVASMVINCYLMAALEVEIWYKLAGWLVVGSFVYLTYGVKNSKEADKQRKYLASRSPEHDKLNSHMVDSV